MPPNRQVNFGREKRGTGKGRQCGKTLSRTHQTVWGLIGSAVALDQVQNGSGNLIGL